MKIRKFLTKESHITALSENRKIRGQTLTFAAAFIMANARLAGDISPFAAAFAASVPHKNILVAIIGGCAGCLMSFDGTYSARLIAAIICAGLVNLCLSRSEFSCSIRVTAPISSIGCSLITGCAVLAAQGFSADGAVIYICESIISGGFAWLLSSTVFKGGSFVTDEPTETLPEFEAMKKALLLRLENMSGGLEEVSQAIEKIADELVRIENKENEKSSENEVRRLVRDQFSTLSTAIKEIAVTFTEETRFDTRTSARVSSVLSGYGITPTQIVCSKTGEQRKIDIRAERVNSQISRTALTDDLESACGFRLGIPDVTHSENSTVIKFEKKPKYNLRIGHAQRIAEGRMCGDSFDIFSDTDSNRIIVISDGMGTGPKAAVDGTVAAWLFSKLIAAGLGFESSLRLANSALIVKSDEESLATIDSVRINLHTGKTDFFKAGAGASLVCKGRKVYSLGKPSLPLGILREVSFSKDSLTLRRGDRLLMMSDGVPQSAYTEIAKNLSSFNKNDPSVLAERVVQIAEKYSVSKHPDDITAIAVIVG